MQGTRIAIFRRNLQSRDHGDRCSRSHPDEAPSCCADSQRSGIWEPGEECAVYPSARLIRAHRSVDDDVPAFRAATCGWAFNRWRVEPSHAQTESSDDRRAERDDSRPAPVTDRSLQLHDGLADPWAPAELDGDEAVAALTQTLLTAGLSMRPPQPER